MGEIAIIGNPNAGDFSQNIEVILLARRLRYGIQHEQAFHSTPDVLRCQFLMAYQLELRGWIRKRDFLGCGEFSEQTIDQAWEATVEWEVAFVHPVSISQVHSWDDWVD